MTNPTHPRPFDARPEQRLKTASTIATNQTSTPANGPSPTEALTLDRLITDYAKIAALYDDIIEELSRHELTPREVDLITIPRAHVQLSTDNLDSQLLEVENHGHSYPMGRPLIPTASNPPASNRVRPNNLVY